MPQDYFFILFMIASA